MAIEMGITGHFEMTFYLMNGEEVSPKLEKEILTK